MTQSELSSELTIQQDWKEYTIVVKKNVTYTDNPLDYHQLDIRQVLDFIMHYLESVS